MLAKKLILHTFRLLSRDIRVTVLITMLPLFLGYALAFGVNYLVFGPEFFQVITGVLLPTETSMSFFFSLLVMMTVMVPTFCWSAVAWHRYGVLQERPKSVLPTLHLSAIRSYFWNGVKIGLVVLLVLMPVLFLFSSFSTTILANPFVGPSIVVVISFVVFLIGIPAVFRIALMLPAAAIGKPLALAKAWDASKGYFPTLFVFTLMFAVLNWVTGQFSGAGAINLGLFVFLNWLRYALTVSMLTSLYVACIQNAYTDSEQTS